MPAGRAARSLAVGIVPIGFAIGVGFGVCTGVVPHVPVAAGCAGSPPPVAPFQAFFSDSIGLRISPIEGSGSSATLVRILLLRALVSIVHLCG